MLPASLVFGGVGGSLPGQKRPEANSCISSDALRFPESSKNFLDTLFCRSESEDRMFLGIDVGTGGTRAVIIDREGKVVASCASRRTRANTLRAHRMGRAGPRRLVARRPRGHCLRPRRKAVRRQRHRIHRPHRADARMRHARCKRRGAPVQHSIWCDQR